MKTSSTLPFILQALLAAIFFGASAPIAKFLLGDNIAPIFLAAFLYLGSGTGIFLVRLSQQMRAKEAEADIKLPDVKWLAGAIISGGILAPIILMISLQYTPASTASLLLNFEGVGTTLIALVFFKEAISRRAWTAIIVITLASIFLSANLKSGLGFSLGALGIILACMLWGLDNNFTRNISGKDPLAIVAWKGLVAGTFSFFLALFLGNSLPSWDNHSLHIAFGICQLRFEYHAVHPLHARARCGAHQRIVRHGSTGGRVVVDCYLWGIPIFPVYHCHNFDGRRCIVVNQ